MKTLPPTVVAYKRTPEFTADTVPPGLLREHNTKAGVWATIVVTRGALRYRVFGSIPEDVLLTPGVLGIIEPTVLHEVAPEPGACFYVEFYR